MKHIHKAFPSTIGVQRPEFWTAQPWAKLVIEPPQHIFPEDDLVKSLVEIYFDQINPIIGILHSPSFHQSISDGLHLRDHHFGAVVLAVCSLASRYSDDPRVFLDGANSEHSCGWKWFQQVRPLRVSFSPEPSLHQLQLICLSVLFLVASSNPEECWILAGLGMRLAQSTGAHHRSGYSRMKPLEAELYKRVFWVLAISDTVMSLFTGRPSIARLADFDLDFPVEFDDEYGGVPQGKPSSSAFLGAYIRLMMIFGRIHDAIVYIIIPFPLSSISYVRLCANSMSSSALNKWVDLIPNHLRWDPNQKNQVFLDQSAALYVETSSPFQPAQVLIHRMFIPAPGKELSSTSHFPSLAICANAARSCGHVLAVQTKRGRGVLHHPNHALFDCAPVLLINVWAIVGGRKSRDSEDFNRAKADAQNCVRVLRLYERRWRVAGRKCDIL
ncbi:fungal-specific transcription factor domain-containing protein, partial [Mycena epipterygia]